MKLHRKLAIIAVTSLALGIAVLTPLFYYRFNEKQAMAGPATVNVPAVAPLPSAKPEVITGKPVRLVIPSLHMELAITDGAYNAKTGAWTLSNDKAHYALPTMQPNNEAGNTLIYGHYRKEVFSRLHKITEGQQAIIETDNGYRFTYTFNRTETVDPADTSVFTYDGVPRLTLQTCTGAFMQHRQLFYFSFDGVEKP
jgi:LPXTG-site transpeptidase (sortase) family protein